MKAIRPKNFIHRPGDRKKCTPRPAAVTVATIVMRSGKTVNAENRRATDSRRAAFGRVDAAGRPSYNAGRSEATGRLIGTEPSGR
jgi:hypothetical protein